MTAPGAPSRVPQLDGLRGIAALLIFFVHARGESGDPNAWVHLGPLRLNLLGLDASPGVDIFLVLTGFVLFLPVVRRPDSWDPWTYGRKRIRRVVPGYWASLGFALVLTAGPTFVRWVLGRGAVWTDLGGATSALSIVSHLTFTHTFFREAYYSLNGPAWTLGIEAQLWLAFPFVVWAWRRWGHGVVVAAFLAGCVYATVARLFDEPVARAAPDAPGGQQLAVELHGVLRSNLLGRWTQFGLGMLLALVVVAAQRRGRRLGAPSAWALVAASVVLYVVSCLRPVWLATAHVPAREVVLGLSIVLLMAAMILGDVMRRPLSARPVQWFAGVSYGVFLLHLPLLLTLTKVWNRLDVPLGTARLAVQLTVGLGAAIALAVPFGWLFEGHPPPWKRRR